MRRKVTSLGARQAGGGAPLIGFGVGIADGFGVGISEPPGDGVTVGQVMRHDVGGVAAGVSAEALAGFLVERNLPGLPVVDREGRLAGVITLADLVRERLEQGDTEEVPLRALARGYRYELGAGFHADRVAQTTVSDLMRLDVTAVLPTASLSRAAALLGEEKVELLPVIVPTGEVVGVLYALDLVRWFARPSGPRSPELPRPTRPLT